MHSLRFVGVIFTSLALSLCCDADPIAATSTLSAVTVYADRAVVTRTATLPIPAAGITEVTFDKLPGTLVDASLQVSGRGDAAATILDVTARPQFVTYTTNERIKPLEDQLAVLRDQQRALDDRTVAVKAQQATLDRIEAASTTPPTKDGAPRLSIDEALKLMNFLGEQRAKLAAGQRGIDTELASLADKRSAIEQQLRQLRGGPSGRSFKVVTVRLNAGAPGSLDLNLTYAVTGATWTPSYDVRVPSTGTKVELGYFGVVHQNTGEEWRNVALTLSTARPSLGGKPPSLAAWMVDVVTPLALKQQALEAKKLESEQRFKWGAADAPAGSLFYSKARSPILGGGEVTLSVPAMTLATADVTTQATSATFKISTPATVPSDNSPQKIPVTTAELASTREYLSVPKQVAAAFLTAKVTNTTDYPLLAGSMNVFVDETFVATSALATVMPDEKFDLALGVDEAIAVTRKLNRKFTEETGLVNKGQRITYDAVVTIENHKKTPETVVVVDQVPVSRNEKVVVKQIAPDEKDLKPEADGTLRWTVALKPGEKRVLPLKFTVEHARDVEVAGLD